VVVLLSERSPGRQP